MEVFFMIVPTHFHTLRADSFLLRKEESAAEIL